MKRLRKIVTVLLMIALLGCTSVFAVGDSFDSSIDPLVSLSYINEVVIPGLEVQIKEARQVAEANSDKASKSELSALASRVTKLEKELANISASVASIIKGLETEDKPMSAAYETVHLTYGQRLFSPTNSYEIILRSGTAEVISPFTFGQGSEYEQGIADVTAGADLADGEQIPKNHLLVIPTGGDGRGILVTSEEVYLLVRGEYQIVE